ncbi:MAG TPA: glycosyltransferase family 39 protein, partial [Bacteroidales bacterium]|nr:glycosyltransferase family 39 protein [Bacteroidales bacterium]
MLKQKYIGFYLITLSAVVLLVLPWLISDGMFMDGQQYACVAMNMAAGKGNFWFPVFTEIGVGGYSTFHEQAPLMFGLQSLFFKVLGNGFLTERIYGFCMLIVTILLMFRISKLLIKLKLIDKFYAFLPVLLWIIVPVVHWSFANNVVEITMGVFILLSFIFILKGTVEKSRKYLWLILAGINIFLASFTKGLPGIFVITVPFLFWFVFKHES